MGRSAVLLLALLLALAPCLLSCAGRPLGAAAGPVAGEPLVVRRGELARRLFLSGELAAARGAELTVPRTPSWMVPIRWLAEDGSEVRAGQVVVELDNSAFTADLEDARLAAAEAKSELARVEAEAESQTAEKELAVTQKQAELEKAELDAAVPAELVSQHEAQERRLALRKAEVERAAAEADLVAQRRAVRSDVEAQQIALDKARRKIDAAESAIAALSLRAPRDGMFLVADHPREGRKLQVGDQIWVGASAGSIPDLSAMQVEARLPDVDDGRVEPGAAAVVVLDAYPEERWSGRVTEVTAIAEQESATSLRRFFRVRVELDRVDPAKMRPGMSVRVEVAADERPGALLAPRAGLDLGADPPRARLAGGGLAEVTLGPCDAFDCVVEKGLAEGAELAREAAQR